MSVSIFTQSIEDATITLTNGGTSVKEILKWRDIRQKGIDLSSSVVLSIEIDFGASYIADDILFGNIYTDGETSIQPYSWNGSSYVAWGSPVSLGAVSNVNYLITPGSSQTATKYKIQIDMTLNGATNLEIGCIFFGTVYTFPVNYQQDNNRGYFIRYEKDYDNYGYGYSQIWNATTKQIYDFGFHLTESQFATLKTYFGYMGFGAKRFFIKDTNVDANWHLAEWGGDSELTGDNISSGYYNIPFMAREV